MFTSKNSICTKDENVRPLSFKVSKKMAKPGYGSYTCKPIHEPDSQFGISYDPDDLVMKIKLGDGVDPEEARLPHGYIRPWKDPELNDAGSTVCMDEEKYEAILDVKQFSPEELTVTIDGVHVVSVEGKQDSKEEFGALVDRYFKRKYYVPPAFDCENVKCTMSKDRILIITIPRIFPEETEEKIVVPIVQTGKKIRGEVLKKVEEIKTEFY